jgi:hypothetical protein
MSHTRVLCVAEKPTVAKAIANILFRPQQAQSQRTQSIYNPKYEFQCNFEGRNVTMIVTSVTGHLMEMDFDDAHRKWHSCDPRQLMDLSTLVHRRVPHEKSALKDSLEELARTCGTLVCCLDGDREGENISFEVLPLPRKLPRTNGGHTQKCMADQGDDPPASLAGLLATEFPPETASGDVAPQLARAGLGDVTRITFFESSLGRSSASIGSLSRGIVCRAEGSFESVAASPARP